MDNPSGAEFSWQKEAWKQFMKLQDKLLKPVSYNIMLFWFSYILVIFQKILTDSNNFKGDNDKDGKQKLLTNIKIVIFF